MHKACTCIHPIHRLGFTNLRSAHCASKCTALAQAICELPMDNVCNMRCVQRALCATCASNLSQTIWELLTCVSKQSEIVSEILQKTLASSSIFVNLSQMPLQKSVQLNFLEAESTDPVTMAIDYNHSEKLWQEVQPDVTQTRASCCANDLAQPEVQF